MLLIFVALTKKGAQWEKSLLCVPIHRHHSTSSLNCCFFISSRSSQQGSIPIPPLNATLIPCGIFQYIQNNLSLSLDYAIVFKYLETNREHEASLLFNFCFTFVSWIELKRKTIRTIQESFKMIMYFINDIVNIYLKNCHYFFHHVIS